MKKSTIIRIMEDAVVKAGRALSRDFGEIENLQVSKKGPGDFVTSADHRAEKIIVRELEKSRPGYSFLMEESGEIKGEDEEHRWIIDPIDGTTNFMHGIPHFCISLALEKKNSAGKREIIAGVIYAPIMHELYWAEKNVGAYIDSRRLIVSSRKTLEGALIGTYLWYGLGDKTKKELDILSNIETSVRVLGSAALELAYVAAGKLDVFWYDKLKPWDMAAGILLVQEAHGIVTEINGSDRMMENGNILATNGNLDSKISELLRKNYK